MQFKFSWLKNNTGFVRYFKNTSWMMGEQFLRIIAGLFVGIWVARYLGPEQFGLFSYALAFTAIFSGIAKLGLDGIIVRELINNPEKRDIYLGTAFWLKILGAIIVMGVMAAIVPFTSNDATTNLFIFIIAAGLVFQSFEVVEFHFQSLVLAKIVTICKIIQLSLSAITKIYLVLTEAELYWFVLVTVFDAMSLAVSYSIAYRLQKDRTFYKKFNFNIAKEMLNNSWPLMISSVVVMVYMRIDQIMIKEILGEREVGIYSAAIRLSEAFFFIPAIITASLFPAILNAKKQGDEVYKKRLQQLYTFMVWSGIGIALPMTFAGEWLIVWLFGHVYQEAAQVLIIHIWSMPFVFLLLASGRWLIAEGLSKIALFRNLFAALLSVFLNLFLIPNYGIGGAAISTLVAFFSAAYFFDIFSSVTRQQFILKCNAILMKGFS
jgi:O-antigen/teichoic acid export membrane protein